jgi:hypothetical protein
MAKMRVRFVAAVLAAVTVPVRARASPARFPVRYAITDPTGGFRFPQLLAGTFKPLTAGVQFGVKFAF